MKLSRRYSRLVQAMMAATLLPCTAAFAAPVVTVGSDSAASANGVAGTPIASSATPSYSSSSTLISDALGSGAGSGWASSAGAYAVAAVSSGVGTANGHAQFHYSLTNDTGVAQIYTMSFHIYGGNIGSFFNQALTAGESLTSSYTASVKVGTATKFFTTATITQSGDTGMAFTSSGTSLGNDDTSDGVYSWGGGYYTIDLGLVGVGQTLDIVADVADSSVSNVGTYTFDCGGGYPGNPGYPGYPVATMTASDSSDAAAAATTGGGSGTTCTGLKGGAYAFYGDPAQIGSTPLDPQPAQFSTSVPEPASLALVGLGLAGAGLATRRRRRAVS